MKNRTLIVVLYIYVGVIGWLAIMVTPHLFFLEKGLETWVGLALSTTFAAIVLYIIAKTIRLLKKEEEEQK